MPLKTWNLKSDWDVAYRIGAEPNGHPNTRPEVKLNYARAVMLPICQERARRIAQALGWVVPGPSIVIVGAGFGWTAEALEGLGFTRVVGIDVSTYVQASKALTEEADLDAAILAAGLNPALGEGATVKSRLHDGGARARSSRGVLGEDLSTAQSRNRVKSALGLGGGASIDWGLSESVLESLTDAEAQTASSRAHQVCTNVAHYVVTTQPGQQAGFNWKALAEWKALIPSDTFIDTVAML